MKNIFKCQVEPSDSMIVGESGIFENRISISINHEHSMHITRKQTRRLIRVLQSTLKA